jgi:hypothetical protein
MIDFILINRPAILFGGIFLGIIIYLIIRKIKEKENEDFENRDN